MTTADPYETLYPYLLPLLVGYGLTIFAGLLVASFWKPKRRKR